ncbi:MarR family winged helix-turn-helix transcriptional regulator [Comamonas testosteroni]|uniref:MarR family winged helix-turn-helix transcriptional regulator n=1 Tax=Comamonas testosteroni TaxID=285 RepID=UPI0015F81C25|nr:MarR family winged helix-turn-helix transcriptional regulator [Comamonas testosteroni]WEE75678.1 MarR family winged helix-turn-helix transcriptional regulator [Comamonas testosteroni]
MPQTKVDRLTSTTLAVFRLNGLLIHWGDRFSESQGLTSARWQMLGALALADQALSAPQIGDRMGVTRQAAQRQLNLLLDEGMVEALANPQHKRSPLYALTPQGCKAYDALDQRWQAHVKQLSRHFEEADLVTTLNVLQSLAAAHATPQEPSDAT